MPSTISIKIPREIVHAVRMTPQELKRELAVHLYGQGKLSLGKAGEMADMTVWEFHQLLGIKNVPVNYDIADYEDDLSTLKEMGRL